MSFRPRVLPTQAEVLTMSVEEYEHRIEFLKAQGYVFSRHEVREIKTAVRRINNRLYASDSRLKKRKRLEFLEDRVAELERECDTLRRKIEQLEWKSPYYVKIKQECEASGYTPFNISQSLDDDGFSF